MTKDMPTIYAETTFWKNSWNKFIPEQFNYMTADKNSVDWLWDISKMLYIKAENLFEIFPDDVNIVVRKLMNILKSELQENKVSEKDFRLFDFCSRISKKYELNLQLGGFIAQIPTVSDFLVVFDEKENPIFINLNHNIDVNQITTGLLNVYHLYEENRLSKVKKDNPVYYKWVSGEFYINTGWVEATQ